MIRFTSNFVWHLSKSLSKPLSFHFHWSALARQSIYNQVSVTPPSLMPRATTIQKSPFSTRACFCAGWVLLGFHQQALLLSMTFNLMSLKVKWNLTACPGEINWTEWTVIREGTESFSCNLLLLIGCKVCIIKQANFDLSLNCMPFINHNLLNVWQ